ncbi:MAG: hypothetical protein ACKV2T_30240 [Kofleriaceae bacterium]
MKHLWIAPLLASCLAEPSSEPVARRFPRTFEVAVAADGTLSPSDLEIRDGDTVRWTFASHTQAIIPVTPREVLPPSLPALVAWGTPTAYVGDGSALAFTGPMPSSPGGIFVLNPNPGEPGLVERTSCSVGNTRAQVGATKLCATGTADAVMDATYADPAITGVFLRVNWSAVNPDEDVYDWSTIDREIDKAIANGKLYSIGVEAGGQGTPAWIFDAGVPAIALEEPGANGCRELTLGSPTNSRYQELYFAMLRELAAHLRARADRFRALAYVKPSGANLFTAENRLPNECEATCACANEVWSGAGFTPTALRAFYVEQLQILADEFPTKTMSYALIQAGFPLVSDTGSYAISTSESPVWTCTADPLQGTCSAPFTATKPTEDIIADGVADHDARYAVQHNGLGPKPDLPCPGGVGSGCPNEWVTTSGTTYTGFQTQNIQEVETNTDLHDTLRNAYDHVATAVFIEIYEERAWEARTRGGLLNPEPLPFAMAVGKTLAAWDEDFRERRAPETLAYEYTFHTTVPVTLAYKEASKIASPAMGTIRVLTWP